MERQIHIKGKAERLTHEESDAYFAVRPRGSQIGAHVSPQSKVIESRSVLEQRLAQLQTEFDTKDIPRPEHWGGFRVIPMAYEFWQGRENRLHDRLCYRPGAQDGTTSAESWIVERLAP